MTIDSGGTAAGATHLASWRRLGTEDGITPGKFLQITVLFGIATVAFLLASWLINGTDYVGKDSDDAMRLVEVRDYLAGQGWFDLHQYRLGPEGGTLMHWSRLIDWPIAMLVRFFEFFFPPHQAEVAAVVVWPLLLVFPLLVSMALACFRLGGRGAMLIGLVLAAVFLAAIVRFRPGAIDHHNVQLILAVFMAAMLVDPLARASNFAAAALAGAVALAIGAETTPLVAVSAIAVALLWAILGNRYRSAAIAFGLTFAIATGLIFLGTTPPSLYTTVTCDTLSFGYMLLAAIGGAALAAIAFALTGKPIHIRFVSLASAGIVVLAAALVVTPECLQNPLNGLDPLLKTMWLDSITEAQSIIDVTHRTPDAIGGFYAVGLVALAVSLMRVLRGEQVVPHSLLIALIFISWAVSAVQVRGMMFANVLAFIPLSALIADLRALYVSHQKDVRAAAAFVMSALLSVPSVWTIGGTLAFEAGDAIASVPSNVAPEGEAKACVDAGNMEGFAAMPPGRILSSFNPGAQLLRFTPHSVLSANYHRNQAGMVAALKMAMAKPQDALPLMERYGIAYVLVCDNDPLVNSMKEKYPGSLFVTLAAGDVPGYLEEIPGIADGARIYQLIQR